MRAELGEQGLDVAPQGTGGNVHLLGHLPGALAIDDPAEHLLLPRGELVQPPVTPRHPGHRAAGQARLEPRAARPRGRRAGPGSTPAPPAATSASACAICATLASLLRNPATPSFRASH